MIQQPHSLAKPVIWKDMCIPALTAALFIIAKTGKQTRDPPIDE